MVFARDVFISYDSDDLAWARRMSDSLATRGLSSFLAPRDIVPGTAWEMALVKALNESKHLVALWSTKAKDSAWVSREMGRFQAIIDPAGQGSADRFIVQVLLDVADKAYGSLQVVPDIRAAGLYAAGADAVDGVTWERVADAVADALKAADGSLPVPVLVVSMTAAQLKDIDLDHKPPDAPSLGELLTHLGLHKADLAACYGDTVRSWRPFGSTTSIEAILTELNQEINGAAVQKGRPFRWNFVDEDFWSSDPVRVEGAANRLAGGPAVVVIDALSLYVELVRSRFPGRLYRSFDNEEAMFLVPAPFPLPASNKHLRSLVRQMAQQVFDHSYEPPVLSGLAYARCGTTITDTRDLKAWVMTGIGPRLRVAKTSGGAQYLSHGTTP
jgi:hypothetical protein